MLAAEGGAGKSTAAIHILACVALEQPVFEHFEVRTGGPVLYVSEEDDEGVIRNRLDAMAVGHGWDADRLLDRFHILAMSGTSTDDPEWQAHLIRVVDTLGCVLVAFDPYGELTSANENSDENKVNTRFYRRLIKETGVTVLVLHHAGKQGKTPRRKIDRVRGWSGLNQVFRAIHFLEATDTGMAFQPLKMSELRFPLALSCAVR